jgi:hypothetical protein
MTNRAVGQRETTSQRGSETCPAPRLGERTCDRRAWGVGPWRYVTTDGGDPGAHASRPFTGTAPASASECPSVREPITYASCASAPRGSLARLMRLRRSEP